MTSVAILQKTFNTPVNAPYLLKHVSTSQYQPIINGSITVILNEGASNIQTSFSVTGSSDSLSQNVAVTLEEGSEGSFVIGTGGLSWFTSMTSKVDIEVVITLPSSVEGPISINSMKLPVVLQSVGVVKEGIFLKNEGSTIGVKSILSARSLQATTNSGAISIESSHTQSFLESVIISSKSGKITANTSMSCKALEIKGDSGNITAKLRTNSKDTNIVCKSGSITSSLAFPTDEEVRCASIKSGSGSINLKLENVSGRLQVSNKSGSKTVRGRGVEPDVAGSYVLKAGGSDNMTLSCETGSGSITVEVF